MVAAGVAAEGGMHGSLGEQLTLCPCPRPILCSGEQLSGALGRAFVQLRQQRAGGDEARLERVMKFEVGCVARLVGELAETGAVCGRGITM